MRPGRDRVNISVAFRSIEAVEFIGRLGGVGLVAADVFFDDAAGVYSLPSNSKRMLEAAVPLSKSRLNS